MEATVMACTCGCGGKNHGVLVASRLDQFDEEEGKV